MLTPRAALPSNRPRPRGHIPRLSRGRWLPGRSFPPTSCAGPATPRGREAGGLLRSQPPFVAAGRTALFAGAGRVNVGGRRQCHPPRAFRALARVRFGPGLSTWFGRKWLTAIHTCLRFRCPFAAVLGGVPGQVPGDRLLSHAPPPGGWSGRREWDTHHGVHLPGGNRTHTMIELSGTEVPAADTRLAAVVSQRIAHPFPILRPD